MQDIINQLTSKIGLSPEQAQGAVQMVVGFIKDKVPAPLAGMLDNFLPGAQAPAEGESAGGGDLLEQAKGVLGGLFK
jgi:hypothetical protein